MVISGRRAIAEHHVMEIANIEFFTKVCPGFFA